MPPDDTGAAPWLAIVVASLVGGVGAGLLFHYQLFILQLLGSVFGFPSLLGGAAVHGVFTLVFVGVFGLVINQSAVRRRVSGRARTLVAGLSYGVALFLGAFGVLLPVATIYSPVRSLPIPYWPVDALVVHLVFGLLVGATFASLWSPAAQPT